MALKFVKFYLTFYWDLPEKIPLTHLKYLSFQYDARKEFTSEGPSKKIEILLKTEILPTLEFSNFQKSVKNTRELF